MKILVTGSKGFIGQNIIKHLQNHHEVSTYDWSWLHPNVKNQDLVIHLGAISSTTATVDSVLNQNLVSSIELFEDCIKHGVDFQFASSASVYGLSSSFSESSKPNPVNHYARSKYLFEEYMNTRDAPIKWQAFRYFNVYGPHEEHKGNQASPYTQFEKQAKENGVIKLFEGSKEFKRDFIHVNDIVQLHSRFIDIDERGIWNFGTGITKSFYEIAKEIADKYEASIEYIPMPDNIKEHYQMFTRANTTKLRASLDENTPY